MGRADGLADRRRSVPGRDGVAGVRALERAHRALDGGHRDDGAHDRAAADRAAWSPTASTAAGCCCRRRLLRARGRADGGALADRHARRSGTCSAWSPSTAPAPRSSGPRSTRSSPTCCRVAELPSQLARPVRAPDRPPAGRAGRWAAALVAGLGVGTAFAVDAASFALSAAMVLAIRRATRIGGDGDARRSRPICGRASGSSAGASGCGARWCRPRSPTCCSWGRSRCCCPTWSRTTCTAAPHARPGVRGRRPRVGGRRAGDGPASASRAAHHGHLRHLDAGHAGGRRLRPGHLRLAADVRQLRVQRAGDGRHHRVDDAQAARRAGRDAGPRVQPRLADLDRPAADLVRADGRRSRRRSAPRRRWSAPASPAPW